MTTEPIKDRTGYLATESCMSVPPDSDLRPSGHTALQRGVLCMSLQVAVPMWISRLRHLSPDEIVKAGRACTDDIASGGDNALYRGSTKKESAEAFNALARGLAALSYTPGGVRFLDCHWDAHGGATP